jgi:hypothetical protein
MMTRDSDMTGEAVESRGKTGDKRMISSQWLLLLCKVRVEGHTYVVLLCMYPYYYIRKVQHITYSYGGLISANVDQSHT